MVSLVYFPQLVRHLHIDKATQFSTPDRWRIAIIVVTIVSIGAMAFRLVKHRGHYTETERLFIAGVILLQCVGIWRIWDEIQEEQSFSYRLPIWVVANIWLILVMLRPPSRKEDNNGTIPSGDQETHPPRVE